MSKMYRHLLRLMLAAVVGSMVFIFLPTASAKAEAPVLNVFEMLHNKGITSLESGRSYTLSANLTVTFNARLDNGDSVNLKIVKHSGSLHDNRSEKYSGYYAQFSRGEDGGTEITFSRSLDIVRGGAFDNDPKCGERGMEFRVNGRAFAVPDSTGKNCNNPADSEVAFVAIGQVSAKVLQWSDDSGHFLLLVRLPDLPPGQSPNPPPDAGTGTHHLKAKPVYSSYTRCEKLPPDAAGNQPLDWVRHAVLGGMQHTTDWSVISSTVTADHITYFPTNGRDIGVDSRVVGANQPFKAIWRVAYDYDEKTVERSYGVFNPDDSTTWQNWPLTDENGRFVRYSGGQSQSQNDTEYVRVLNWHKWVCSSQTRVQKPQRPAPGVAGQPQKAQALAPTVWVNATERCDDNTIAISTGGESWPPNPLLRVFEIGTGKMSAYVSYNTFSEQWNVLGNDTARFKVELVDAETGAILATDESDQIGKRVDCKPAAPSATPAPNLRAVNEQRPHSTVFFGNNIQMAARWMGAHDELPSTGLGQKRTTTGDYFFCHATTDCKGLDVGYMEVQDRETLAVKKYVARGYIDVDFDGSEFRDPSKLKVAATLGYCLDPVYHPATKTWHVTKVRIWLYDQMP
jgi:hypothetical protein